MTDYERLEELRDTAERALDAYFDYAQAMVEVAQRQHDEAEDEVERLRDEMGRMRQAEAAAKAEAKGASLTCDGTTEQPRG